MIYQHTLTLDFLKGYLGGMGEFSLIFYLKQLYTVMIITIKYQNQQCVGLSINSFHIFPTLSVVPNLKPTCFCSVICIYSVLKTS